MQPKTSIHTERLRRLRQAGIYLVTSQALSAGRTTLEIAQAALAGGIRLIQLREKELPTREFFRLAEQMRQLTDDVGALLIITDRLDIALAVGADGVHLGQEDLPITAARRLAPDLIIGASTHSIAEAQQAEKDGASYINIGPLFPRRPSNGTVSFSDWKGCGAFPPPSPCPSPSWAASNRTTSRNCVAPAHRSSQWSQPSPPHPTRNAPRANYWR